MELVVLAQGANVALVPARCEPVLKAMAINGSRIIPATGIRRRIVQAAELTLGRCVAPDLAQFVGRPVLRCQPAVPKYLDGRLIAMRVKRVVAVDVPQQPRSLAQPPRVLRTESSLLCQCRI